jgi:hypothetical protein
VLAYKDIEEGKVGVNKKSEAKKTETKADMDEDKGSNKIETSVE